MSVEIDIASTCETTPPPARIPMRRARPFAATTRRCGASRCRTAPCSPSTPRIRRYLRHTSALGDFRLTSDSIIHTYRRDGMRGVSSHFAAEELAAFVRVAFTIGGYIVFPGNRVGGRQTINQARGTNPRIDDRFDLTLECIRRYYAGEDSPLAETLALYPEFFALFGNFSGYCEFFLLQDLLTEDGGVRFLLEFDEFGPVPCPRPLPNTRRTATQRWHSSKRGIDGSSGSRRRAERGPASRFTASLGRRCG